MKPYYEHGGITLHCGDWRDVLAGVRCDAIITDPPYSARTHEGHDDGASGANKKTWVRSNGKNDGRADRRSLEYISWNKDTIDKFVASWSTRCAGWIAAMSDSELYRAWRESLEYHGRTGFQPLPCVIPGMTVRLSGDGPSSWAIYLNVARPRALSKWGTLPGAYICKPGERVHIGGKPLSLMRAIIRDYTKPGDLVCDPCAGAGTTLIAAAIEGRRAIGAEIDPETFEVAVKRIERGYTPDMFGDNH